MLELIATGAPGTPQDETLTSSAPVFGPQELTLDWQRPALSIIDQVRAVGDDGALATLDTKVYRILHAEQSGEPNATAGTVREARGDTMLVSTGSGALRVRVRPLD